MWSLFNGCFTVTFSIVIDCSEKMILEKGRGSTNYGQIAYCILFGGWVLKGVEKTTAGLVTCPQLFAFPARPGVHLLPKCFSRGELSISQVLHCL